jgi:hypothetical protein
MSKLPEPFESRLPPAGYRPVPAGDRVPSADDALPPVEPPGAGFLLQLFFIPLVIVAIVVVVWLMFSWLAHMGTRPEDVIADLERLDDGSWQKALTLADLLRDPRYGELKDDPVLALRLAKILDGRIDAAGFDPSSIRLRIYLCRALGEFRVVAGLPVLIEAATTERDPAEVDVRYFALQGIAVLADNVGREKMLENEALQPALARAAAERDEPGQTNRSRARLRESAAFALGVLGGPEQLVLLEQMLADADANTRFNAALGLARHGDVRSLRVLVRMLDPANPEAVSDEPDAGAVQRKRASVLLNGLAAAEQLAERNPDADLTTLKAALETLKDSDAPGGIRTRAAEVLYRINHPGDP